MNAVRPAPCLSIVVPCYNEEEVLPTTIEALQKKLDQLISKGLCAQGSFLLFIDDGSHDLTWSIIAEAGKIRDNRITGLKLAVNAGHQYALLAGLDYVTGRCQAAISIDADLQDDLDAMDPMLEAYKRGTELVLGVRESRSSDTMFKRGTASFFYWFMRSLGVDVVTQHADYRLLSSAALRNLQAFPEYHMFLRGLQTRLSGRIERVFYDRKPRLLGESKYPLSKMLSLAWNGITSFSIVPLRLIAALGAVIFVISGGLALYAFSYRIFGNFVPGWASITIPLYMLGGITLLSMGIVGEYIGKIYIEVKRRPRYIIEQVTQENDG